MDEGEETGTDALTARRPAAVMEYVLLLAMIVVAAVVALTSLGLNLHARLAAISEVLRPPLESSMRLR